MCTTLHCNFTLLWLQNRSRSHKVLWTGKAFVDIRWQHHDAEWTVELAGHSSVGASNIGAIPLTPAQMIGHYHQHHPPKKVLRGLNAHALSPYPFTHWTLPSETCYNMQHLTLTWMVIMADSQQDIAVTSSSSFSTVCSHLSEGSDKGRRGRDPVSRSPNQFIPTNYFKIWKMFCFRLVKNNA